MSCAPAPAWFLCDWGTRPKELAFISLPEYFIKFKHSGISSKCPFNSQEVDNFFFFFNIYKKAGLGSCCGVTLQPGAAAPPGALLEPALPRGLGSPAGRRAWAAPTERGDPGHPTCTPDRDMVWGHQCDNEPPPRSCESGNTAAAAGPGWEGDAYLDGLHSSTQRSSDLSH